MSQQLDNNLSTAHYYSYNLMSADPVTLEQHKHEVCAAFSRAATAMRDAANTAENFLNWFSRVNNMQNMPLPPPFNGNFNFIPNYATPQQQYPAQVPSPEQQQQSSKKRKAADDTNAPKKRREKKLKDANAPKRPPSPYLLFQNEVRKTVQAQNPEIPYGQLLSTIAKMWKTMTPEEREPYRASQAMLKAKYEQEKIDYETNPLNPLLASVPAANKVSTTAPVVSKTVADTANISSDDSSDESTESSSSSSDEDEEVPEPVPEPPRKKSKKEAAKVPPTPPAAKANKKKEKSSEGKKKKKADT